MSKKIFPTVISQDQAWDTEVNDTVEILQNQPFPLTNYTTVAGLPAANQNDDGMALVDTNDDLDFTDEVIVISSVKAAAFKKLAWQSTEVLELTDNTAGTSDSTLQALTDPAATPASATVLRDDLVANLIPELRNNLADLAAKQNALIAAMKNTGAMASA